MIRGNALGFLSDDTVVLRRAPRSAAPVVVATGRRFGCNMIAALSTHGSPWFSVFSCRFDTALVIRSPGRLLESSGGRKPVLFADSHPTHRATKVTR